MAAVLALLGSPPARGRSGPPPIPEPASQPSSEILVVAQPLEDPGGRALRRFNARLRALHQERSGRVRISHWGDSHATGEVFTGHMRHLFQEAHGDGGPGFVLLANPWRSYRHSAVKVGADPGWRSERFWGRYTRRRRHPRDNLLGLAGISAHHTTAGCTWVIPRNGRILASADLYYLEQPGGGRVELLADERTVGKISTRGKVRTAGFARFSLPVGTARLDLRTGRGEVRLYGVDLESGTPGVVYDSLGLNGARAASLTEWNEELMGKQVGRLSPDLVVLAYGSNEVDQTTLTREAFAERFERSLRLMRRTAPHADFLVLGPPDRARWVRGVGASTPANLDFIVAEQRRLALALGCAFWDQRAAMGGPGSILRWAAATPALALRDHVHLTAAGYRLLAEALFEALRTSGE